MKGEYQIIEQVKNKEISKKDFFGQYSEYSKKLTLEYAYTNISSKILIDNFFVEMNNCLKKVTEKDLENDTFINIVKNSYNNKIIEYVRIVSKQDKQIVLNYINDNLNTDDDLTLEEMHINIKNIILFLKRIDFYSGDDKKYILKKSEKFVTAITEFFYKIYENSDYSYLNNEDIKDLFEIYNEKNKKEEFIYEGEEELATYSKNQYINDMNKKVGKRLLTAEEELELGKRIKNGDKKALEILVYHNWRLVLSAVRNLKGLGVDETDLTSAGNIGLIEAAKNFDPEKNLRFSTYAMWGIRKEIFEELQKNRNIRIPKSQYSNVLALKKFFDQNSGSYSKDLIKEASEFLEISEENIKLLIPYLDNTVSLQSKVGEESTSELLDFIPDEERFEEQVLDSEIVKSIMFSKYLTPTEKKVINLRFGLEDGVCHTYEEIGEILRFKKQYANMVYQKALTKIKKHFSIK